jgi:hypothetical protein
MRLKDILYETVDLGFLQHSVWKFFEDPKVKKVYDAIDYGKASEVLMYLFLMWYRLNLLGV